MIQQTAPRFNFATDSTPQRIGLCRANEVKKCEQYLKAEEDLGMHVAHSF